MRTDDFEYGFLGRVANDLQRAAEENRGEGKTDFERAMAIGAMRGVVTEVASRIENLRASVRTRETVLTRIRDLLDDRARYERDQGDRDDARAFFEVDLEDADSVDDLLYYMEHHHWSRECDEYAVVWAVHMVHKFGAAMAQMLDLVEEMSDGRAA